MLIGTYNHSADEKGRVFVPSKWRDDLGEAFYLTKGLGKCLLGMHASAWETLCRRLAELPMTNAEAAKFSRLILGNAFSAEMDKQGRILLPANLRAYAGLEREISFVGVGGRIEIWDAARWEAYNDQMQNEYEEVLARMAELGI